MKKINEEVSFDASVPLSRRDFFGIIGVVGLTLVAVDRASKPEQKDATETVYDMTRQYNELNTNFEHFFFLASHDRTARWKQEGNKRTLIHEKYNLSVEGNTMFLIVQDAHGDTMNVTYVMQSGKFSIDRENVDRDTIRAIDRAMRDLQEFFQK